MLQLFRLRAEEVARKEEVSEQVRMWAEKREEALGSDLATAWLVAGEHIRDGLEHWEVLRFSDRITLGPGDKAVEERL